jgi:hypothetical protein
VSSLELPDCFLGGTSGDLKFNLRTFPEASGVQTESEREGRSRDSGKIGVSVPDFGYAFPLDKIQIGNSMTGRSRGIIHRSTSIALPTILEEIMSSTLDQRGR